MQGLEGTIVVSLEDSQIEIQDEKQNSSPKMLKFGLAALLIALFV